MSDCAMISDDVDAKVARGSAHRDSINLEGHYVFKCFDGNGNLKWEDEIDNLITTVGKNAILDSALAGSAYTATGPFMGLISSVGYTGAPVIGDTMASHPTWFEVDGTHAPQVSARLTTNGAWSAASGGAKALSSTINFTIITTGGTIKGGFLVFGAGAVATIGSTAGTLLSAGLFTGGDKVVAVNDVIQASYTLTLT